MFCATPALISVLPMVLLFMSRVNILSVKSLVQSLPRGTEEKALWVRQMVVVKQITHRVVNMSSAFVAPCMSTVLLKWQKRFFRKCKIFV